MGRGPRGGAGCAAALHPDPAEPDECGAEPAAGGRAGDGGDSRREGGAGGAAGQAGGLPGQAGGAGGRGGGDATAMEVGTRQQVRSSRDGYVSRGWAGSCKRENQPSNRLPKQTFSFTLFLVTRV